MPTSNQDQRGVDALIQGSQQKVKKMSLLSDRQVKLWKVMLVGLFVAGFVAAIAFAVGTKVGRETVPQQESEAAGLPVTVELLASPAQIQAGQNTTLTWSSANAFKCKASGGWSGEKPANGSETVTPGQSTTYSMICRGAKGVEVGSGSTGTSSVTVVVSGVEPPQVSDVSVCPWTGPGAAIRGKCNNPKGCSLDVYQSDPVKKTGAVRCANNAIPCGPGQNCESPVQDDGLTYVALVTDMNGVFVRYNKSSSYSSVAIIHPGGGGAGKWLDDRTDYPNDGTDWSGLQNDHGVRVVGVLWATTGVECGSSECGRWLPKTDNFTDIEALAIRPDAVFRWVDANLNIDNKPLALLGSSGGAHAILSPAMVGSSLMDKVKYLAVVSLAPLTDYYYGCTNTTPAGMYINQSTGEYTTGTNGVGAALNSESGTVGPKGLPDAFWNIQSGQAGCVNAFNLAKPYPSSPPASVVSLTTTSNVSDILDRRIQLGDRGYTGVADFIVCTQGGSDNTCGCTWAEGRMFNHPYFSKAAKTWSECASLPHGGALSQPNKQCFDQIYNSMVSALGI